MKRFPVGEPGERWTEDWRGRLLSRWLATRYDGGITAARWNLKPGTGTETSVTRGGRIVGWTPKKAWGDEWLIDDGWRKERGERRTREENKRMERGGKTPSESESVWCFQLFGKTPVHTVHGDEASQTAINIGLESAPNSEGTGGMGGTV